MGYVAVEAGEAVIERAAQLFDKRRTEGADRPVGVDQLEGQLGRLIGQVMGEGGLYAPTLAALAVKQAQGDTAEAAFLLRAYRSTLERWGPTVPVAGEAMFTTRRVSPAYKDVPGGQLLGGTKDYTQRLLDFDLLSDAGEDPTAEWVTEAGDVTRLRDVLELLRAEGLVHDPAPSEEPPVDTTRTTISHPAPRSAILQELARGETGAVTALGYSELRGYGQVHPTLGEVRSGELPVCIEHPYTGETVEVLRTVVTETECVVPIYAKRDDAQFAFGYGLVYGRNERKAIAMSILDAATQLSGDAAAHSAEFILDVIDGIDSFGFIEHLKLPHYVTFQSILDRIRELRRRQGRARSDVGDDADA